MMNKKRILHQLIISVMFICSFILFTAIGTISHEYGHIVVAKSFGYSTQLSYASAHYEKVELYDTLNQIYLKNKKAIENDLSFAEKGFYDSTIKTLQSESFLITLGGPMQTILTGMLGLFILYYRRRKIISYGLRGFDWMGVFLSLFWLREVFNLLVGIFQKVLGLSDHYFGGDEKHISAYLDLPIGFISLLLCCIGAVVGIFIVFKVIPLKLRLNFILSGILGGGLGYYLWMEVVGPRFIP